MAGINLVMSQEGWWQASEVLQSKMSKNPTLTNNLKNLPPRGTVQLVALV